MTPNTPIKNSQLDNVIQIWLCVVKYLEFKINVILRMMKLRKDYIFNIEITESNLDVGFHE